MRCRKTVTEKKIAANRLNAKQSTGPRTERGKNISRFNAVTTGLFAERVVIPSCDGDGSETRFQRLLGGLQQEFQPEGPLEEFYVAEMAKNMWRLRRATCAEKGAARRSLLSEWGKPPTVYEQAKPFMERLSILQSAKQEIKTTGTLSPAAYAAVLPVLKLGQGCEPQAEESNSPAEPKIDDQLLVSLDWQYGLLYDALDLRLRMGEEEIEDYHAVHALPSKPYMKKILQYETAAQKRFDWALQKLQARPNKG
jgi:hypothetical protein